MQNSDFFFLLERIGRERGLSPEVLLESVKEALLSAYKKKYGQLPQNLQVILDEKKEKFQVLISKKVVKKVDSPAIEISLKEARKNNEKVKLGDEVEVEVNPFQFSRIAASTGKYVMIQQIVEMEKDLLYQEFKKREGEMISGTVRYEADRFVLIDLGKTEGILPKREQLVNRKYRQGGRIKAYILRVTREPKGPRIVLSQSHPNFLRRLFELEVPEIGEGIVKIRQIKRDAGRRAKVVVESEQEKVDPVGACVGLRGSRIKAILLELEKERIDIIRYSEDTATFIKNSLKPAEVMEVKLDESNKVAKAIVADDQLSLAIGSHGENVKLAVKLTGWQIDVRSLEQIAEEVIFLKHLAGIGEKTLAFLKEAGFLTHRDIVRGGVEALSKVRGIGPKTAEKILKEAMKIEDKSERKD